MFRAILGTNILVQLFTTSRLFYFLNLIILCSSVDHCLLFIVVVMVNRCPNPCCDFTYSNSRYLSQHFNSFRGQHCFAVQQSIEASSVVSRSRRGGLTASAMAIYEYRNNTTRSNRQSLSSLFTTFTANASATTLEPTMPLEDAGTAEADMPPVADNDEATVAMAHDNDNAEALFGNPDDVPAHVNPSFTYTTHQLMVAKLLSMLDAWNAPNYCFKQIIEWYKEARQKKFPLLVKIRHVLPTSR